jgi:CRP-like cAMP-binding protein
VQWRLFEGIPDEEVRELLKLSRRRTFRRGEIVVHQNDPADSLHLISKGHFVVRVMTPLGEPATLAVVGPGDMFGEMALIGENARRSATVEAIEEAETLSVHELDFARIRQEHPSVNEFVIRFLVSEVRVMNERLLEAYYVSAERRVLRRVVELSRLYGSQNHDGPVEIPLTQETLAGMAGTSRATVNAVLREAQTRGLVELARGNVRVVDTTELAKRAR